MLNWMIDVYGYENICDYCHAPISHPAISNINDLKFSIVRNPYSRAVSLYQQFYKILKADTEKSKILVSQLNVNKSDLDKGFDYFIQNLFDIKLNQNNTTLSPSYTQYYYLSIDKKISVDVLLRYEDLETDFEKIKKYVKTDIKLPTKNVGLNKKWKDYSSLYTPSSKKLVEEYFKKDLEFFNYCF